MTSEQSFFRIMIKWLNIQIALYKITKSEA